MTGSIVFQIVPLDYCPNFYLPALIQSAIFSAKAYTVLCGCPGGNSAKLLASTTRSLIAHQ